MFDNSRTEAVNNNTDDSRRFCSIHFSFTIVWSFCISLGCMPYKRS